MTECNISKVMLPYQICSFLSKISVFMFLLIVQTAKGQNVWENSGQFEGDIILPKLTGNIRNVMHNRNLYWPKGQLPYELAPDLNSTERDIILTSLRYLSKTTCIKTIPARKYHQSKILISGNSGHGCSSTIGYWNKKIQRIHLDRNFGCINFGVALHELLHVLGFWHQHSSRDRDNYVEIKWDNIRNGQKYNFEKAYHETVDFGFPYDYGSIMHYSSYAFSKNGRKTLVPKKSLESGVYLGQRDTLSEIDIGKIKKMYNCD